jgi:hypothetical protein
MSRRIFRGILSIDSFATDFTRRLVSSRLFALLANPEPHSSNTVLEMTYRGRLSLDICLPVLYKIVRETVQICPGCSPHNGQNIATLNAKKSALSSLSAVSNVLFWQIQQTGICPGGAWILYTETSWHHSGRPCS